MIKYPRTYHLPFSKTKNSDDKILKDLSSFYNQQTVITEKMDGENSTLYRDYYHARSLDSKSHPSRTWLKNFHNSIKHNILKGYRICGENLYAKHSIHYTNLKSYFYGFNIWDENNICLSYEKTLFYFKEMNIIPVPELYLGIFNLDIILKIINNINTEKQEGVVIRNINSFHYNDFKNNIAKWVRDNHVQTNVHWLNSKLIKNSL